MPLYQYICEEDGTEVELLRSMADADAPFDDPEGRGRTFVRRHSTFQVGQPSSAGKFDPSNFGGCACGNPQGPCGRGNT